MGRSSSTRFVLAFALLLLAAWPALAQQQTGDLYGTVTDEQKQPLPGVTVTLTGVGAPQVQQSDAKGNFRFLNLYPGTYGLKAELDGFSTVERPDLTIKVGGKVNIEVTLNAAVKDVITVTGEAPLLDERRVTQGSNVSTVELDKVPTARDPWSLLSQAPGVLVDRVNVGGNESGQQSNFIGLGSGSRDNAFAVDGVILTDMNAVGGSATYFDFGAFEEVQFTVSSADVTVQTSGVTINQVTKRGTNEWRGTARYLDTDGSLQSDPDLPDGNRIDKVEEYGADIGGPLVKDHLWIWGAYGVSDIRNIVQGGQLDKTKLEDYNFKGNFQTGQRNSGVLHYWTNDKLKQGRGAGPDRQPGATHDQTTPQDIYKVEDTFLASANWSLTGLWSRDTGKFTLAPEAGFEPHIFIDADGIYSGTDYDFKQDATIDQERLDTSYFFNTGSAGHELKFGGSFREQSNTSGTVWPHGNRVYSADYLGTDLPLVEFFRNRKNKIVSDYGAAWAQDTITLNRWTVNAGVRYDRQYMKNLASFDPGQEAAQGLLPAIDFKGNHAGGFTWNTVEPRVGVTYALGENRQTLLRGTFSRYAEQLGQLPLATRVNPLGYNYAYFYFDDANQNLILDPGEIGSLQFAYTYNIDPNNPTAVPNVNDPNLKPTLTDEITFGIDQGFGTNLAVGLNLTYRNVHDIPEARIFVLDDATGQVRLATRDDWVQVGTVSTTPDQPLPNGQQASKPYYDLRDGLTPTGGSFYTNGDRKQRYLGASLSLTKRLADNWSFRGHINYADWKWKLGPQYRKYDDPTDTITDLTGFADDPSVFFEKEGGNKSDIFTGSRWSFNMNGIYQIAKDRPWGFNVAANLTGREGYITPPYIRKGGAVGSRSIQLASIDEFRNPNIYVLDGRIDKDLHFGDFDLTLSVDGFNLTNKHYILQRERNYDAGRFYLPNEELSPRVFRLGATLRFR